MIRSDSSPFFNTFSMNALFAAEKLLGEKHIF